MWQCLIPPPLVPRGRYGCLEVFDDKLKLQMVGAPPDGSKLPSGWPTEVLEVPRGGQLVSAGDAAGIGFFLSFLFFMLNIFSMPLQPVFRMLTSKGGDAPPDAEEGIGLDDPPAAVEVPDYYRGEQRYHAQADYANRAANDRAERSGAASGAPPAVPVAPPPAGGASTESGGAPPDGEPGVVV